MFFTEVSSETERRREGGAAGEKEVQQCKVGPDVDGHPGIFGTMTYLMFFMHTKKYD